MAIDTRRITDLYRVRNGYAEFTVGSGRNKRYGIIDRDGRIVAEPVFRGFPWRMGIAERYIQCCTTLSNNPQYRLFDTRPWPVEGHDGLFYTFTRQGRRGIRNSEGRQIIPEKYGRICRTGDNFIVENPQTGYCAIFTPVGEQIVPFSLRFEYVWPNNGRPLAKQDDKWYYIDGRGERISEIVLPDGTEWAELYGDRIVYGCGDKYANSTAIASFTDAAINTHRRAACSMLQTARRYSRQYMGIFARSTGNTSNMTWARRAIVRVPVLSIATAVRLCRCRNAVLSPSKPTMT